MALSRFPISRPSSSSLFLVNLLRLNRPIPVVPPFGATVRLFHATPPTSDSGKQISGDHLRSTIKSFKFLQHPYQRQGPMEPCDLKEDANALFARLDMPGISKEGLKLWYEDESVYITGKEGEKDEKFLPEDRKGDMILNELPRRTISTSLAVSPRRFKIDQIKASLKNGVLRVVIPKHKHKPMEGNNDVACIEIE
ncbi:23.6 kDa heat shock protein, mitochondrial-like [Cornus florida]|uniref:23.6 kDa heat shock protein, mitochondrial-like n=1 Tax=Cornus florida TaxID=4283 RepID=UPI0028A00EAF|nr:23.6 kDa heat shock protein, mitochondrial-like [Cornus florida]